MPLDASNNKADQSVSVKDDFNAKIVKNSELKAEYKRLAKTNFTFTEKVQLSFCKPLYLVRLIKIVQNGSSLLQQLADQSPDRSLGLYEDEHKNSYMSGAFHSVAMNTYYKGVEKKALNKKAQAVSIQAFENCQDYRNKAGLRPIW